MFNFLVVDTLSYGTGNCTVLLFKFVLFGYGTSFSYGPSKSVGLSKLRYKINKRGYRRLKNYRFRFRRRLFRRINGRLILNRSILKSIVRVGGICNLSGIKTRLFRRKFRIKRRRWFFKFRFKGSKFRFPRNKYKYYLTRRNRKYNWRLLKTKGSFTLPTYSGYTCSMDLSKDTGMFIHSSGIWRFSKFFQVDNLFSFNIDFKISYNRLVRDFINLYFTINSMYSFSYRNNVFKKNKFALVYGITHLIFFKTFFYLDIAMKFFFKYTVYKKHRLLLIVLRKLLNTRMVDFYEDFGLYGIELFFFGKLGGFGGSKKRRYRIVFGYRPSMSINYRVHQYLHEYSTPHGRIGSRCKITLLN